MKIATLEKKKRRKRGGERKFDKKKKCLTSNCYGYFALSHNKSLKNNIVDEVRFV